MSYTLNDLLTLRSEDHLCLGTFTCVLSDLCLKSLTLLVISLHSCTGYIVVLHSTWLLSNFYLFDGSIISDWLFDYLTLINNPFTTNQKPCTVVKTPPPKSWGLS